jgi:hypothetical protein
VGKLLLANIRGPKGDPGGPYKLLSSFYGSLDSTGVAASDAAITNWIDDCASSGVPGIVLPGTYKVTSRMDWRIPGLQIAGSGSKLTRFRQATANTGVVVVAGGSQKITGLDFGYSSQEIAAHTNAVGLALGDDTVGSCFMSEFDDILLTQCQRGLAINPEVAVAAGLFSCEFHNIRALGYSQNAIDLAGNNGGGLANCTGVVFNNTYLHNNFSGSAAQSASYPVFLESWDEITFNQLNIEHGESFNFDVIGLSGVANCMITDLHIESIQLSGSDGKAAYISLNNSGVSVRGMSVRFGTMSGTVQNSVVRFAGSTASAATIEGFNEGSENTFSHAHPWADFGGKSNCSLAVRNIINSKTDTTAVSAGAGCFVKLEKAKLGGGGRPSVALAETIPRWQAAIASSGATSGSVYGRLISLEAGELVSHLTFCTNAAAKTGGSHGWYALLDLNSLVLAVTADQTDAATVWGTAQTKYSLDVVTPYTVPVDGEYYMVECVVASGMPTFLAGAGLINATNNMTPNICGSFGSGKTTPPAVGSSLSAITTNTGMNLYGYVS